MATAYYAIFQPIPYYAKRYEGDNSQNYLNENNIPWINCTFLIYYTIIDLHRQTFVISLHFKKNFYQLMI